MTPHPHDQPLNARSGRDSSHPTERHHPASRRPWWLMPAVITGLLATVLVIGGFLPLSTVISVGLLGGMLLMHVGGHGHGGHAGGRPTTPKKG